MYICLLIKKYKIMKKLKSNDWKCSISIALLSIAISFFVTLVTVGLTLQPELFTVFTIVTVVGFIVGIVLMILCKDQKNDNSKI